MFLARMFSTHPKHTACEQGWNETQAGTSSRQIMHSSSPSFTLPAMLDSDSAARPWPHTLAVCMVLMAPGGPAAAGAEGAGRGGGRFRARERTAPWRCARRAARNT